MSTFVKDLDVLLSKYSKDTELDTPDFVLSHYLNCCLTDLGCLIKEFDTIC
jgi:hypothetical protein